MTYIVRHIMYAVHRCNAMSYTDVHRRTISYTIINRRTLLYITRHRNTLPYSIRRTVYHYCTGVQCTYYCTRILYVVHYRTNSHYNILRCRIQLYIRVQTLVHCYEVCRTILPHRQRTMWYIFLQYRILSYRVIDI